jgi:fucose permease
MTALLALIGAKALLFLYIWLLSSMAAAYMAERKGYNERAGLATGLVLTLLGAIIWLVIPAKPDSKWKTVGAFGGTTRRDPSPKSPT